MMANKHDIVVHDASGCLWLPEAELQAQSQLLQQLLLRRIPNSAKRSGDFAMELESGFTVLRKGSDDLNGLGSTFTELVV
jgi:hypothetical protein